MGDHQKLFEQSELNNNTDGIVKGFYKWPFAITKLFYTRSEGESVYKEETKLLNGLMSRAHISGFVYELLEKLNAIGVDATATLIQHEYDVTVSEDGKRIDMDLLPPFRYRCKELCSEEPQKAICRSFEQSVARIFLGKTFEQILKDNYSNKVSSVCEEFYKNSENHCENRPEKYSDEDMKVEKCPKDPKDVKDVVYYKYNCPLTHLGGIALPIMIMGNVAAVLVIGQFAWDGTHSAKVSAMLKRGELSTDPDTKQVAEFDVNIENTILEHIKHLYKRISERIERNEKSLSMVALEAIRILFAEHDNTKKVLADSYEVARKKVFHLLETAFSLQNIEIYYRTLGGRTDDTPKPIFDRCCLPDGAKEKRVESEWQINPEHKGGKPSTSRMIPNSDNCYAFHYFRDNACPSVLAISFTAEKMSSDRQEALRTCLEPIASEIYSQFTDCINAEEQRLHYLKLRKTVHELGTLNVRGMACITRLKNIHKNFIKGFCRERMTSPDDMTRFDNESMKLGLVMDDDEGIYRLIGELANSAKPDDYKNIKLRIRKFNINSELMNGILANYRYMLRAKDMRIERVSGWSTPNTAHGDPEYIANAVNNVLNNALKYGYAGTNIYYSSYWDVDKTTGREYVVFEFTDYGEYIEEQDRERIFDDGVRTGKGSQNGMGLGLFIAKTIVEAHNGRIEADSVKICDYALPYLSTMQENIDEDFDKHVDIAVLKREIDRWENKRAEFREIVNREQYVDRTGHGLDPNRLYEEVGISPTAKTTFRIYLPLRRD